MKRDGFGVGTGNINMFREREAVRGTTKRGKGSMGG